MLYETITSTRRNVIEKIEGVFEYGYNQNILRDGSYDIKVPYMRNLESVWFANTPKEIFKNCGIETSEKRAQDISNLFEGSLIGYYYVSMASNNGSDEPAKMLLGYISETFKVRNLDIFKINYIIPSSWLKGLIEGLESNKIPKKFQKNFIDELIDYTDKSIHIDNVIDELLKDSKYTVMDSSLIDGIVDIVFTEYPQAVLDAKANPKKSGFLIGQIMKMSGGSASPQDVSRIVGERLSED